MDILISNERLLHRHNIRTNETAITDLLHPDFLEVGKSGQSYDYRQIIDSMQSESLSDSTIHSQDYEAIRLEDGAYLLLYKTALINRDGKPTDYAKRASVWINNGVNWLLRYHQGTPCSEFELKY